MNFSSCTQQSVKFLPLNTIENLDSPSLAKFFHLKINMYIYGSSNTFIIMFLCPWRISKQGGNYDHAVETLDIHSHDMINIASDFSIICSFRLWREQQVKRKEQVL